MGRAFPATADEMDRIPLGLRYPLARGGGPKEWTGAGGIGAGDPALEPPAELRHSVSASSNSSSSLLCRSSMSAISMSSSSGCVRRDELVGLDARMPCRPSVLLTASSSLLDPSRGIRTTPSSSSSSSEVDSDADMAMRGGDGVVP